MIITLQFMHICVLQVQAKSATKNFEIIKMQYIGQHKKGNKIQKLQQQCNYKPDIAVELLTRRTKKGPSPTLCQKKK